MKNDNDKWLESLRESLDGFEVEPRPGIWDSIERDTAAAVQRLLLSGGRWLRRHALRWWWAPIS